MARKKATDTVELEAVEELDDLDEAEELDELIGGILGNFVPAQQSPMITEG